MCALNCMQSCVDHVFTTGHTTMSFSLIWWNCFFTFKDKVSAQGVGLQVVSSVLHCTMVKKCGKSFLGATRYCFLLERFQGQHGVVYGAAHSKGDKDVLTKRRNESC